MNLAPNGKPSNLTPEQYRIVRTREFKAWFGDWENDAENSSKVVDDNGEPLVVYHGGDVDFNVFDVNKTTNKRFHFTTDREYSTFKGGISKAYFLKIHNLTYENWSDRRTLPKPKRKFVGFGNLLNDIKNLKEVIVFEPTQIKLADGTNTTFDSNNPDIRYNNGGLTMKKPKTRPFTDDGNKNVVYSTKDYKIAVDNVNNARYITLWFVNSLFDLDVKVGSLALYKTEDDFLKVQEIDIQKSHRGKGMATKMYLMALKYSADNIKGIKSYLPDRVNKRQIPKIYKALNAKNGGDDYAYIYKADNLAKFKKGGAVIEYDDKIFYHGTDSYFQKFDLSKVGSGEGSNKLGEAIYLTPDLEKAKEYGRIILEVVLRKGLKLIDYDQIKHQKGYYNFLDKQKKEDISIAKENFARLKFDGMFYGSKELIIFNEKNVKVIGKAYKKGGNVGNSVFLSKSENYGSYEGIIHYDIEKIKNWFLNRNINYSKYLKYLKHPIAFLNNINVDSKYRNKGYGNDLYSDFEQECYENDVKSIILESDSGEYQKKGFDLDSWYESFDFEIIGNEGGNSIMIKILDAYKKGGSVKNLSKTPAPKKDRIYGSSKNKPKSSESKSKASSIILSPTVIKSINTILKEHNEDFPKKKIPLSTAKAVVRRGMGAFSSSYRPTISGGKPNSRVAWGLARLKAFVYKIQKGHSKSGKYKQDNDLIDELGYKHDEYKNGGEMQKIDDLYKDHHNVWAISEKIIKNVCEENCSKYSDEIHYLYELELKPHFIEEEKVFFPSVINENNKDLIKELIKEHHLIKFLAQKIKLSKKTKDIKEFCNLMIEHIKKEELIMKTISDDPYKNRFKDGGYIGSCVDVGSGKKEVCKYFPDATIMAQYVGNPDENDWGKSKETTSEEFYKFVSKDDVPKKSISGNHSYHYISQDSYGKDMTIYDTAIYFIYNVDSDIHYFFKKTKYKNGGLTIKAPSKINKMPSFIAPNGERSNLMGIKENDENGRWVYLYDIVRTAAFKNWFGDWEEAYITKDYEGVSKIIDENGEPSICYHVTSNEFYEFNENYIGSKTDKGYYGKGFYFTEGSPDSHYGEREIPCFLNIKNPYLKQSSYRTYEINTEDLKNKGHDGLIVFSNIENVDLLKGLGILNNRVEEIVAYYPEQIKLADATNRTFDKYDSDIRYNEGGNIPMKEEEYKYFLVTKNQKPVFKVKFSKYKKETERDMSEMLDKLYDMDYILKSITEQEYKDFDYGTVDKEDIAEFTKNWSYYKNGGKITDERKETYKKWKSLVNMSSSELNKFLDSEEGKVAGLSRKEANELGIDYGRESARWILRMKDTPYSEWTPNMWRWAKKQISFISRMSGNKGKLFDENGKRTRKYLSLLVWGNNPLKK